MTPKEEWNRLNPLVEQALGLDPLERAEFLERVRLDDETLGRKLASLVEASQQSNFIDTPTVSLHTTTNRSTRHSFVDGELVLDRFKIVRFLGRGGMGDVYEATDLHLGRVAIKTIRPEIAADESGLARFRREVQLARKVTHTHVCRIHDLFTVPARDGRAPISFLTMEYLAGVTLAERIENGGALPLGEAESIALQLCDAIQAIHDAGIVHRDLKSRNVMLVPRNGATDAVVMDLGLARETGPAQDGEPGITRAGAVMGTPEYMAPEQFQGDVVTPTADIYATGVMLYEMVTGSRPFRAGTPAGAAILRANQRSPASSVRPQLPRRWDAAINKCLEFDPARRFQSSKELAGALRGRLLDRKRIIAYAAAAILAVAAMASLARSPLLRRTPFSNGRSIAQARTLVVLPFENPSADPVTQAFCDGLLETLTNATSESGALQSSFWVVPASEVRHDKIRSIQEARKAFNVNLAMTGSVIRAGDRLQVTVSLSEAGTLRQLASRVVLLGKDEAAGSQKMLLGAVLELLQLETQPQAAKMINAGTSNSRAFSLYLEGQGYLRRLDGPPSVDKAVSILEQAVQLDPFYGVARSVLAEAYYHKFDQTKDTAWLARADAESARAVALDARLPQVHTTLGMIARGTGRYDQAVAELRKAVELDPADFEAQRLLARTLEDMGRSSDAETVYLAALRSKPSYWPTARSLGLFYFKRGEYAKAEPWLKLVTELVPGNEGGFLNLGILYYSTRHYSEAISALKKSIALRPLPEAFTDLGTVQFFQQQYGDAVSSFEKAVQLGPNDPYNWGNLADSYRQIPARQQEAKGAYRKAIQLANHLLDINPNDANLHSSVAVYLAKSGDKPASLAEISRALRLPSQNVNIAFNAAQVYEIAGNRALAIRYLKDALERGYSVDEARHLPDFSDLRTNRDVLRLLARYHP